MLMKIIMPFASVYHVPFFMADSYSNTLSIIQYKHKVDEGTKNRELIINNQSSNFAIMRYRLRKK